MTTIAYKDGVLAADGRETEDGVITSEKCQKIFQMSDGRYVAISGDSDWRAVKALIDECGDVPDILDLVSVEQEHGLIIADPEKKRLTYAYVMPADYPRTTYTAETLELPLDRPFATGSGGSFAIGAMFAGKSAVEAVEIAKKSDIYSGGDVSYVRLWGVDRKKRKR